MDEFMVDIESVDDDEFVVDMDGIPGPRGYSAYEIAVQDGYVGTETEWLASLKGAEGETPNVTIGTITTLPPGSSATATITGTAENPVLNLGIPEGGAVFG